MMALSRSLKLDFKIAPNQTMREKMFTQSETKLGYDSTPSPYKVREKSLDQISNASSQENKAKGMFYNLGTDLGEIQEKTGTSFAFKNRTAVSR